MDPQKSIILTGRGHEQSPNFSIDYYGKENKQSIINMLPPDMAKLMEEEYARFLLGIPPESRKRKIKPCSMMNRVRISFWKEYEMSMVEARALQMQNVYGPLMDGVLFSHMMRDVESLCWMLTPPTNYVLGMEEALNFGLERLREILEMPLYERVEHKNKDGRKYNRDKPNVKVAELMIKVVSMLDTRVKGAVVKTVVQNVSNTQNNTLNQMGHLPHVSREFLPLDELSLDEMEKVMRNAEVLKKDLG